MSSSPAKFVVFAASCLSLSSLHYLLQQQRLAALVVPAHNHNADTQQLIAQAQQWKLPLMAYDPAAPQQLVAALDQLQVLQGLIITFSHILPESVVEYFQGRLYNLHASDLPNYRGSMPLYWQLRHGLSQTQLTLHRVTAQVDAGEIGLQLPLPIHPLDTLQSLSMKVMELAPQLLQQALAADDLQALDWQPQRALRAEDVSARRLRAEDVQLPWAECSATEIAAAARAGNPHTGGVQVNSSVAQFQIMEAMLSQQPSYGSPPGTILCVDKHQGLVVATRDGALALTVVASQYGYYSGYQFALRYKLDAGLSLT